jgi:hypothetical protein
MELRNLAVDVCGVVSGMSELPNMGPMRLEMSLRDGYLEIYIVVSLI